MFLFTLPNSIMYLKMQTLFLKLRQIENRQQEERKIKVHEPKKVEFQHMELVSEIIELPNI